MNENKLIDYGPLAMLEGVWKGDKGIDIAPDPDGIENNLYYETIAFSAIGNVSNAETQKLAVLHYRQIVKRMLDDEVFHDETGYWMWDSASKIIMHSFTIPRGVSVLAGAVFTGDANEDDMIDLQVSAEIDNDDWSIIQSPFMQNNAKTVAFDHKVSLQRNKLSYIETTTVEIYGKTFEHIDQNSLTRI